MALWDAASEASDDTVSLASDCGDDSRELASEPSTPRRDTPPRPKEIEMGALREGMRSILASTLERVVSEAYEVRAYEPSTLASRVVALEREVYNVSIRIARTTPKIPHRRHYAKLLRSANLALSAQVGPYPNDVVALLYAEGARTAEAIVEMSKNPIAPPTAREIAQRMFVRTLMSAHPQYGDDKKLVLDTAKAIEISCYNAAVRISKESEEPPRRQWDSPAFVDIYSTRCGAIDGLLNPQSSACRAYGANLAARLLNKELAPGSLGDMTEKELCPQATSAERAEIAKRSEQKVEEKESNLFRCPHCGERRSAYREVQRRCLDEPPDYLCVCLNVNCRHRFTGYS